MNVGEGDFTVAAWIHPQELRRAGIVSLGAYNWSHGWYLDIPDNKGSLRIETAGPDNRSNGTVTAPPGTIRADAWQHVAAVVRRGKNETRLYVNGYPVAKGDIWAANLDNPKMDLHLGRIPEAQSFRGELDEVRMYRRALGEAEIQALVQPGRQFATAASRKTSARRADSGRPAILRHVAATCVPRSQAGGWRAAGPCRIRRRKGFGAHRVNPTSARQMTSRRRFLTFEKRSPRLGVHLGLRRDCGSTFARVGVPQTVGSDKLTRFVFEGAIRNFPSPDVEKDNVNYLAGIREIARAQRVHRWTRHAAATDPVRRVRRTVL